MIIRGFIWRQRIILINSYKIRKNKPHSRDGLCTRVQRIVQNMTKSKILVFFINQLSTYSLSYIGLKGDLEGSWLDRIEFSI